MDPQFIRNFCIIAHIDHGKSTLADRLLELTGTLTEREMTAQVLDSMDLERERGITIKAKTVRLAYKAKDGNLYRLNLIDTPGHVDFSYEVSRALQACEGALLVVDASQGVEAQTVANTFLASQHGLTIVPVINKVDLPAAQPEQVKQQMESVLAIPGEESLPISAKTGLGVPDVLEAIVKRIPPPKGSSDAPLQALIFDSWFDPYRGAIVLVRVKQGRLRRRMKILLCGAEMQTEVEELGTLVPKPVALDELGAGDVGYVIANIKRVADARVGDTIVDADKPAPALPGFEQIKPMVFAGLFPVNASDYENLRDALGKLQLNDAALFYEPENSTALGFGFRCGFLGLLHMDIVQERLEREFDMDLITTAPTVIYEVVQRDGTVLMVDNPSKMPEPSKIEEIREPIVNVNLYMPQEYVGAVITLCTQKRGIQVDMIYHGKQVLLKYEMPMGEIVLDFFDKLKSVSRGYASMDYEFKEYRPADVVKVDMLINSEKVDALSIIVHRANSQYRGREVAAKMREIIPRQMFDVAIQAAIGANIIARENVKALRKNVLAKCYGGDITRKKKLLEKQKAGKKRMKQVGSVEIPQEAFLAILQVEDK